MSQYFRTLNPASLISLCFHSSMPVDPCNPSLPHSSQHCQHHARTIIHGFGSSIHHPTRGCPIFPASSLFPLSSNHVWPLNTSHPYITPSHHLFLLLPLIHANAPLTPPLLQPLHHSPLDGSHHSLLVVCGFPPCHPRLGRLHNGWQRSSRRSLGRCLEGVLGGRGGGRW